MQSRLVAITAVFLAVAGIAGTAPALAGGGKEVTVSGKEFGFSTNRIVVAKGEELVISFRDDGRVSHNLTIPALEVGTGTIQSGDTAEIRFTPEKAGTYSFICTVPGHERAGMHGELVVE